MWTPVFLWTSVINLQSSYTHLTSRKEARTGGRREGRRQKNYFSALSRKLQLSKSGEISLASRLFLATRLDASSLVMESFLLIFQRKKEWARNTTCPNGEWGGRPYCKKKKKKEKLSLKKKDTEEGPYVPFRKKKKLFNKNN